MQVNDRLHRPQFLAVGATVQFASATLLPNQVDLTIERQADTCLVHLVWQRRDEAGLLFRAPAHLNETMSLD